MTNDQIAAHRAHNQAITLAFHIYDMQFDHRAFAAAVAQANAELRYALHGSMRRSSDIKVAA